MTTGQANNMGSGYMRYSIALPGFVRAFPAYLRDGGYCCTNRVEEYIPVMMPEREGAQAPATV